MESVCSVGGVGQSIERCTATIGGGRGQLADIESVSKGRGREELGSGPGPEGDENSCFTGTEPLEERSRVSCHQVS